MVAAFSPQKGLRSFEPQFEDGNLPGSLRRPAIDTVLSQIPFSREYRSLANCNEILRGPPRKWLVFWDLEATADLIKRQRFPLVYLTSFSRKSDSRPPKPNIVLKRALFSGPRRKRRFVKRIGGWPFYVTYRFLASRTRIPRKQVLPRKGHSAGTPQRRLICYENRSSNKVWRISLPRKTDSNHPKLRLQTTVFLGARKNS